MLKKYFNLFLDNILLVYIAILLILGIVFYKLNLFFYFLGFFVAVGVIGSMILGIVLKFAPIDESGNK